MVNEHKPFHWGLLGTAEISRKNWKAIKHSGNGIITAVASRELERSQKFIAACDAEAPFDVTPRALGSYAELLAAEDVHGVYIPLPTGVRKEWVIKAAEAGKHVVCEKPCAASLADLTEMTTACERNGVQFMDGVMFMHSKRLARMREVLDDGETIGAIRRITSAFSFNAPPEFFASNIRAHSELEPLGCLGDLGWYCIRMALWAMKWQTPQRVSGRVLTELKHPESPAAVPVEFSGELLFEGGVTSSFYCSFQTDLQQWADLSGTRGPLRVSDFVLPFYGGETVFHTLSQDYQVAGCEFKIKPTGRRWATSEHGNSHASAQETQLFRNFAAQAQSGKLNAEWPRIARQTQAVVEACLQSARAGGQLATVAPV